MPDTLLLGEFEHIVLLAILRLGDNAYGVTIRNEIQERTGREPAPGALYTTLDRLEDKGLLTSELGSDSRAWGPGQALRQSQRQRNGGGQSGASELPRPLGRTEIPEGGAWIEFALPN